MERGPEMDEKLEDFAPFRHEKCLYSSVFNAVKSTWDAKIVTFGPLFVIFRQKTNFESPQTLLKQGIQGWRRFWDFSGRKCLYSSICGAKNVKKCKKTRKNIEDFHLCGIRKRLYSNVWDLKMTKICKKTCKVVKGIRVFAFQQTLI